jgi:membrane protease YdiL (CAAX protease family)
MLAAETRENPFWTYEDLALFVGAVLPSWALALILMRTSRALVPAALASEVIRTFLFQSLVYALLLGALYLVVSWRHGRPFWRSLGWTLRYRNAFLYLSAGPILAIATSFLGAALRAPNVPSPIEQFIKDRISLVIVILFTTVFGPVFEEIVFRGFLLPLLMRSVGPWLGILLTAVPFAVLHGPQNQWAWQQILLVGLAGAVFGYARYVSGSTVASTTMHAGYNLTFILAFLAQRLAQRSV